jgi:hypothetical protein
MRLANNEMQRTKLGQDGASPLISVLLRQESLEKGDEVT